MTAGVRTEATLDPDHLPGRLAGGRFLAVYEIGRRLLEQEDPGAVTRGVLDALVEHLGAEHACVLGIDPWRVLGSHRLELGPESRLWPLSHSVLERVREGGLAVLASDVRHDPVLGSAGSVQRFRIRSVLCVPFGRGPARGLVYLDSRSDRRTFTADDLEFATAVAGWAGLVLQRAEALEQAAEALATERLRAGVMKAELLRHQIVGSSPVLLQAFDTLRRLARGGARVLLRGETGTGKELFARAYALLGPRAEGPYVPVPVPALPPTLVESELFGHVRGAFTEARADRRGRLEVAHGGVLFLDEVGDVEPGVQVKLLRFLDSGELVRVGDSQVRRVDALVVSATGRAVEDDVAGGRFRADLFARLGHVVRLPPLRERPEDVPLLVAHFLGRSSKRFTADAMALLQRHRWPLNVRELQQVVERCRLLVDGDEIGPGDLPAELRDPGVSAGAPLGPPGPLREVVEEAEKAHILRALAHTGGNRRRAIEMLQIAPETFYRRLEQFGIGRRDG